ncbi:MAG: hypothetical protein MUF57_06880, partial [Gammaproteobacteria bacterium]|nr:hypothetical protein [Gammaproteobacteria bacterium]
TIVVDKSVSVAGTAVPPPLAYDIPATSTGGNVTTATPAAATDAGGKHRYVWQAEPAVTFNPSTTDKPATQVTYDRMGQVKLWCEVHTLVEGAWHTVGECEQVSVEVIAPEFAFTFTPPNGQARIGQEVRAVLGTKPPVAAKLIDYRWLEPASSNRSEYTDNASEIGFKVKDAKPVPLNVLARVPHHGDAIAELSATYTGIAYDVQIGAPRLRGPQLQVWVCDTQLGRSQQCGMRDIPPGQFVTFQDIDLPAIVTPKPESPRYRWSVSPSGSCGLPGSGSELHLNCSDTGSYVVALEVTDADANVLGKAETSVSISVRMEQTKPGRTPDAVPGAKAAQEARSHQLAETAAAQIRAGQYDGARATIAALRPLDPAQADRLTRELAAATTKDSGAGAPKRDLMNRAEQAMLNGRCDEARALMGDIAARSPTAQERKWLDMMSSELATRTKRKRCVGVSRPPAGAAIPGTAPGSRTPPPAAGPGAVPVPRPPVPPVAGDSPSGRPGSAPPKSGNWTVGAPGSSAGTAPGGRDATDLQGGVTSPGGRDASGTQGSAASPVSATGAPIRIEACVDGSDLLRIENGRLVHEHRGFAQIGAHPDCPPSHVVPGGGLIVDGRPVSLAQLPYAVGIGSLDRFEVEQARGAVRLDGARGLLLDDDGPGGPAIYVVRLHGRAASAGASTPAQAAAKPATLAPPTILTGRWRTRCESDSDVYPVTIQQEGNRLSIVVEGQGRYQGTFDGHRLSGTSSDGLDRFTGEVVAANELRLDWEGRLSAGGQPFRNRCTLSRE